MTAFDVLVIGGGVLGTSAAIQFAHRGLRVALIEKASALCVEASGRNAGGLPTQIQQPALVPYALASMDYWQGRIAPFSMDVDFHQIGSLAVAVTEDDERVLLALNEKRIAMGADIRHVTRTEALSLEPELAPDIRMAGYCPTDGHVNPLIGGKAFEALARSLGVHVFLGARVTRVEPWGSGYEITAGDQRFFAHRVVLATGAWMEEGLRLFDFETRLIVRINQMAITERSHWSMRRYVTVAAGNLSVKQLGPGTIAIGGGWQGRGSTNPEWSELDIENFINNLRLATRVVPRLRSLRIVRTWTGFDLRNASFDPILGRIPGHENAYMLGGLYCGWHIGPCVGAIFADTILGIPTKLPLPQGVLGEPIAGSVATELSRSPN